jgi:hypothetical protein
MNKAEADLEGACTVLCGEIDGDWMKKKKKLRSYVIIFISISRYC